MTKEFSLEIVFQRTLAYRTLTVASRVRRIWSALHELGPVIRRYELCAGWSFDGSAAEAVAQ